MKLIFEALTDKENKKNFRELVKKYHPDNTKTGDEKIMKRINNAADKGDWAFEQFRDELLGKKSYEPSKKKSKDKSVPDREKATEGLASVLREEFKDDKEVSEVKTEHPMGLMLIVYIMLKDGKRVVVEYTTLKYGDTIETMLLDKNGDQLTIKLGKTAFDKLTVPYAGSIPSSVRVWIKHKDEAYLDNSRREDDD